MIVFISLNQTASEILMHGFGLKNNLPFYHLYILIEFGFVSWLYYRVLKSMGMKTVIRVTFLLFSIVLLILFLLKENIWVYPDYIRFMEGLAILIFSGAYFYRVFQAGVVINILNESMFWISAGLTVYFASNCLLFLFGEFVAGLSNNSFMLIWTVHAFLTILLYIAYTIAIQCKTNHNLS